MNRRNLPTHPYCVDLSSGMKSGSGSAMNGISRPRNASFALRGTYVFNVVFGAMIAFSAEVATIPPDGIEGIEGLPPLAKKYCAACHLPPPPEAMPSGKWPGVFEYMGRWIQETQLPFDETEYEELLAFYVSNSPEKLEPVPDDFEDTRLPFQRAPVGLPAGERPRITNVNVTDLDQDGRDDVLICDDVSGRISWLKIEGSKWSELPIAAISAPAKTVVLDVNEDGNNDIVVASLGDINPTDDLVGSAWVLLNRGNGTFESLNLLNGVPRIADIKSGDFDGDGKIDFVVAMFGWRETGGIVILQQETETRFRIREISDLNGAMQIEVIDFDEDGLDDFVALFSQEHENIVLFRNEGDGGFTPRILARAPHPAFGSSGFDLVDLDADGDIDLLYTNGDMMDEISVAKPYHGVRWFENIEGRFHVRELARMTGCYRAVAHDMNGDGHLDVVASSLNFYWDQSDLPSVIWLENDGEQNFTAQRISYAPTNLATMDVGDLNADGLPDIIAGGMHLPGPLGREGRVTVFFQQETESSEEPE